MRGAVILLLLLIAACDRAPSATSAAAEESPCSTRSFEETRFTVCKLPRGKVEVRTSDTSGKPYRSFSALEGALGERSSTVAFAMNAGMFDDEGHAIGLLIEDGKQLHAINRRKGGGNFHLMPNGVFLVRDSGKAEVVTTPEFESSDDIQFATQSGPMLLIDGRLHPAFEPDGRSRHFRNGVGIAPDGSPVFVISADLVSFGKLARFYRDVIKAEDALFFDGAVSSLWDPANGRRDTHSPLGPIVVAFRPAE